MARRSLTIVIILGATLAALPPARAQFGSIFGSSPPRPPANVPSQPPPPNQAPSNQPPSQPLPAPMNLPPAQRPGAGAIESQPLGPPPGTFSQPPSNTAPLRGSSTPPAQQAAPTQLQTLPGLPPGQRQPRTAVAPAEQAPQAAPPPKDEIVVEPPEQKIANPTAVFSGLDKITGRTISFDVAINETVQFGALQVTPRVCYSRPPTETARTDSFVAVDEVTLQGEVRRIFTGWMFAASPGLHAVEHPIYDVWLTDCKGAAPPVTAEAPAQTAPTAKPKSAAPAPAQRRRTAPPSANFTSPFR